MLIIPGLLMFEFFLLAGILGTPVGNRNIIVVFVWILWWFFLISIMVPLAGRVWCAICPLPAMGEWLQRLSFIRVRVTKKSPISHFFLGLNLPWPKKMRNIWLQNFGFLTMASFSIFLVTRTTVSVAVLGGIMLIAIILSLVFKKRAFCLYVCPVSGFLGLYSMTSKIALRAKDVEICNRIRSDTEFSFDYGIAPCRLACPAGVDSSSYIALIAKGKYKRALEVIRESMPFPGVCGRICTHPCESECIRAQIDDPVSICRLKRFVADQMSDEEGQVVEKRKVVRAEKVAIIGSGPAGLTCAFYLAKKGYAVTVYEALAVAGGMLKVGIPDYKLDKDILDEEIEYIKQSGVTILTNKTVGKDITFDELQDKYQAIFIAVGAPKGRRLEIEGENLAGVYKAIDFLRKVNLNQKASVGKSTLIMGGGDTAIDAARVALRGGAEKVTIIYRRSRKEMPAIPEEVSAAEAEGVNIQFLTSPLKILGSNGRVSSLLCTKMRLGEPDESGRRRPVPIKGSEYSISADTVMVATGQYSDITFLPKELKISKDERITVEAETMATNLEGVFAGGDVVSGPDVFVNAVVVGRKAAIAMERYLRGEKLEPVLLHPTTKKVEDLPLGVVHQERRVQAFVLPAKLRVKGFEEVESGFTGKEALEEAERCLNCGICGECYRGGDNEKGWPCPWFQRMGGMDRNNYCGLCMECVKSCPHDNIGLYWRPFASDTKIKGYDEAWKAFIMLTLTIVYSINLLGPWGWVKNWANVTESGNWGGFFLYIGFVLSSTLVVLPGIHLFFCWLSKLFARAEVGLKEMFIRYSYPLVPLGLFAWIAFSVPLLMVNGAYIISVMSDPLGWGWNLFGTANFPWTPVKPHWVPYIQTGLLGVGLYYALFSGYRIGKQIFKEKSKIIKSLIPQAILYGGIVALLMRLYVG